eukprot:CAMPEP_0196654094 /NCGR_PEP_ID=MMETSP1086-20130531/3769_1 /TAXON_ID=77921 /ORGANISM="Cyanoptyche  gloeocystis , Strain SAG4.97" /LENGTH=510 /DNA_ID=CAMNT_0041985653 /DNA_START=28 /DNA_END=1560 /DNA_ORIENTATION=+
MSELASGPVNGSHSNGAADVMSDGEIPYDYDLLVIGGGSGGLACSKEAAHLGKRVAVCDFVSPSPQGTTWGLGGTCVNVGCIPKKLMHQSALLSEAVQDSEHYGWEPHPNLKHSWTKLIEGIQDHIGSLNWGYKVALRTAGVEYLNMKSSFVDPHTVACKDRKGKEVRKTAANFVIAVGCRPKYPDIPGAKEYGITSDDLFSLPNPPGKTLVVGASYIALECGGFLSSLGFETHIMARSVFLRGFDQELAEMIASYMEDHGSNMIRQCIPTKLEKLDSGRVKCTYKHLLSGMELSDDFDTVLFAIGREACTNTLGLDSAGVRVDMETGKIDAEAEQSNVPHIYAIGDVLLGKPELTPVAIQAGKLLAQRMFGGGTTQMDYVNVPTTVFTPLEYGCCGLSEEVAATKYGEDDIEVYLSYFKPLEWTLPHRDDNRCFAKIITRTSDSERVVGFHILAPNAGEITQGYSVAIKCGMTKEHLDATVGIHPTIAEEFTTMAITKRSGRDAKKTGC